VGGYSIVVWRIRGLAGCAPIRVDARNNYNDILEYMDRMPSGILCQCTRRTLPSFTPGILAGHDARITTRCPTSLYKRGVEDQSVTGQKNNLVGGRHTVLLAQYRSERVQPSESDATACGHYLLAYNSTMRGEQ
jgi:hypothetical protein